jgi:hypothetical protein
MKFLKSNIFYYLVITILVLIVYEAAYGLHTLNPTNINWLMSAYHDWGTHYLGWAFYRNDPWTFPLGAMQNYYAPIGTNVGFTDSIPLLALIFKVFTSILPEDFQYFGLWILSCHLLLGIYSFKIFNYFRVNKFISIAGIIILIANPVLIFRGMHPALCAHWLLVGSIYYYLIDTDKKTVFNINKKQTILLLLSCLINPYLTPMVAGFSIILPLKNYFYDKTLSLKNTILFPIISFLGVLIIWISVGLITFGNNTNLDVGNIYGAYSFNLNSFFNSFGHYSHYIPALKMVTDSQHEGFAYLGVGVIILFFLSTIFLLYQIIKKHNFYKINKALFPLLILVILLLLFSISNKVSFQNKVFFTYPLPDLILKIGNIFRANGRFIWTIYYLIILFSIILFSKITINKYIKIILIFIITLVQVYDTENLITARTLKEGGYKTPLKENTWRAVFGNFNQIITYPLYSNNFVYKMDYQDLAFLALKSQKPITNGYVARENIIESQAYRDTLRNQLNKGEINKNQLFVTTEKTLDDFNSLFYYDKVIVKKLDSFILIYSKENPIFTLRNKDYDDIKLLDSIKNSNSKKGNLNVFNGKISTGDFEKNIEYYNFNNDVLNISGWVFDKTTSNNKGDSIFVSLKNDNSNYLVPVKIIDRGDITAVFKKNYLNDSGFKVTFFTNKIPKADYSLSLVLKNKKGDYKQVLTEIIVPVGKNTFKNYKLLNVLPKNSLKIISNLENAEVIKDQIVISGWAAIENNDSRKKRINLVLIKSNEKYVFETDLVIRNDVTVVNKNKFNYDNSGFKLKIKKNILKEGDYKIGLLITDLETKTENFQLLDKFISL